MIDQKSTKIGFYIISTLIGYLMLNTVFAYIYIYMCVCVCVCIGSISSLIHISLNIIEIFCLHIFLLILSYCRIDF